MNKKLKLMIGLSLVALVTTGCSTAPAPWAKDKGNTGNGVKHTHRGVAHTHPLPSAGIHHTHNSGNTGNTGSSAGNTTGGITHQHGGTTHSHPLPLEGVSHNHGGGAIGTAVGDNRNTSTGGSYTETYGGYGDTSSSRDNGGFYDTDYPRRDDSSSRYGDTGYGRDYDTSSRDRDTGYDSGYDSGRSSSSSSRSSDTYTVQKGDTVFAVMRETGAYWKDIIRLNDLQAPKYEIQPGQRLTLPRERDNY